MVDASIEDAARVVPCGNAFEVDWEIGLLVEGVDIDCVEVVTTIRFSGGRS